MNKITIAFFLMIICSVPVFAQFPKGAILVGGNTSFSLGSSTSKSKINGVTNTTGKATSFSLQPQAGYFVADNIAIGAGFNVLMQSSKLEANNGKSSSFSLTINPFARYYFGPAYGQFSVGLGTQKSKFNNGMGTSIENTSSIFDWSLALGYPIFLGKEVTLEPQLGYESTSYKFDSNDKSISGGLFLRLGVYGYLSSLGKK